VVGVVAVVGARVGARVRGGGGAPCWRAEISRGSRREVAELDGELEAQLGRQLREQRRRRARLHRGGAGGWHRARRARRARGHRAGAGGRRRVGGAAEGEHRDAQQRARGRRLVAAAQALAHQPAARGGLQARGEAHALRDEHRRRAQRAAVGRDAGQAGGDGGERGDGAQ